MIVLVLGGTRSGKSAVAERFASRLADGGPVTYLATARVDPADTDHAARIDAHRRRRPATWTTIECGDPADVPGRLQEVAGPVLLDSIGTWVAGHADLDPDPGALVDALRARSDPTVLVGEEVGASLHAPTEVGRRFVDAVGEVNQAVSAVADEVLLVVAGRALRLPAGDDL